MIRTKDIQTIAPIAGGIGSLVLMEGGTKFYVSETPEVILQKNKKLVDNEELN